MRSAAIAIAAAAVFAPPAASMAGSQSYRVAVAAIETEGATQDASGASAADAGPPAPQIPTTGNPLWAIPISKLSATRDRPLFSASRRPPPPAVAAAPVAQPAAVAKPAALAPPPFTLVGTIVSENRRIAILFDQTSKTATGVREGEQASGWTLRSVESRSAILEESDQVVRLDLPEPSADGTSVADGSSAEDNPPPRFLGPPRKHRFHPDNPD